MTTFARSLIISCAMVATMPNEPAIAQPLAVLDQYKVPVIDLKGVALGDPDTFARPSNIAYIAGRMVVVDRRADLMIHVLDARSGKTVHKFGRRGGGPGEFEGVWAS